MSKKDNKKLKCQVKNILKRRLSSSSEDEDELATLNKKIRETEAELENLKKNSQSLNDRSQPIGKENDRPGPSGIIMIDRSFPNPVQNSNVIVSIEASYRKDDNQMLGPNYEEDMVCIGNDVYCRKVIHDMALGSSHKSTHVARKLLEGVFKKSVLTQATLTGQPARAQGLQKQLEPVVALSYKARETIIDFSIAVAKLRGWDPQTRREIERAMSQRLGEIKRQK
ncbi:uncharacterized protein LOC142232748 [Haematobia irritans]|uniref:uncharacterized protein LOC142232748 n=1 Tax=Haematobia irritans TaxID=7368 RepID=UPI003F5002B0